MVGRLMYQVMLYLQQALYVCIDVCMHALCMHVYMYACVCRHAFIVYVCMHVIQDFLVRTINISIAVK